MALYTYNLLNWSRLSLGKYFLKKYRTCFREGNKISVNINKRINNISQLIGNTPLLEIQYRYKGQDRTIYAKAEGYNLTGSIKDRMALYILKKAYEIGTIKEGDIIVEATSGNTGISFSAIGTYLGHRVSIYMPDWMSKERINLIKSFGAGIELVSADQGGFLGSIKMTEDLAKAKDNIFLSNQFSNDHNIMSHYETTGPEIIGQLKKIGIEPAAFVAGVGTGGTIMGIGKYLKEKNKNIKLYPLEPANSPVLTVGYKKGTHRIQGISDEFVPPIVKLDELDEIISIDDGDAIIMAQMLSAKLGLGVGISSGANFLGALKVQNILGRDKAVVTIFADDNKKYLSTDLMKEEEVKEGFLSTHVDLIDVRGYKGC